MPTLLKFLLLRYLRFDKSQPFITLSAVLAFLGVSIGLMVLIIAMAIMNGFSKEFERKLFVMNYPITMLSTDKLILQELKNKFPNLNFSPFISSQVLYKSQDSIEGGILFGVDSKLEKKINSVFDKAIGNNELNGFEILKGKDIKQDDKLNIVFNHLEPNAFSLLPRMKRFSVVGSFSSGLIAYDKSYTYTDINALSKILGYKNNQIDGIHIYSNNPFKDIEKLKIEFPNFRFIGWWQQNGNFFSAMALEKRALFIVLMLIILVASLNIISSLLMSIMNRRKEIALLLSFGASKKEIKNSFFAQGFLIGFSGIIFGFILGFVGIFLLGNFDIINLPADVYGSSKLPLELDKTDLLFIVFGSLLIVALSSYYPAKKASEIDAIQTLRNE